MQWEALSTYLSHFTLHLPCSGGECHGKVVDNQDAVCESLVIKRNKSSSTVRDSYASVLSTKGIVRLPVVG